MPHSIYPFICWWHLGCSHFLAVVDNTAMNIGAQVSEFLLSISVLLIIYLQVKLLGQMVILRLVFEEPPNCFPQYLHHFSHQKCVRDPISAYPCWHLLFSIKKKKSYPSKCEVIQIYIFKGVLRKQYGGWTEGGKSIRQRKQRRRLLGNGFSEHWSKRVAWPGRAWRGRGILWHIRR